ncbi:MAG TPA: efflux RND transporter periplasmic adaptor subunit [Chroococcales cyanobacterium]
MFRAGATITATIKRPKVIACAAAIAVPALLYAGYSMFFDLSHRPIDVTGTIQAKEIPVASKVGGRISQVFVSEGQEVKAGAPLVEFEMPELQAKRAQLAASVERSRAELSEKTNGPRQSEIDKARASAAQAFANWQMLKNGYRKEEIAKTLAQKEEAESNLQLLEKGYRKEEIDQARAQMEEARVQMEFQKRDWERYQYLSTQGAVRGRDREEAKSKYDAAVKSFEAKAESYKKMMVGPRAEEIAAARERARYARAQQQMYAKGPRPEEIEMQWQEYLSRKHALALLEQGTRKEEIAKAEAELSQCRSSLAEIDAQLKEGRIVAPADSEVSVMDLHKGEVIGADKPIATLTKLDEVWTRVYIPERELGRVHVGQEVDVKADAFPNAVFHGKIVQIPSVAEFTPRNVQTAEERSAQVFGLKITIDNKEHSLRGGMNALVTLPPVQKPFGRIARVEHGAGDRP